LAPPRNEVGEVIMTEMSNAEIGRFLMQGTFTGKLATTKKDGSSHIVPIWFVLADSNSRSKVVGDIIFTTGSASAKAKNIRRDNRVSICVDDQTPQFSFVTVYGTAKIYHYKQKKTLRMGN
jgi:general stress protein 26